MEIVVTIPEWAFGKNIYVFAGKELMAYSDFIRETISVGVRKEYYKSIKFKNGRCNGCGQCCESGSPFSEKQYYNLRLKLNKNDWQENGRCSLLGENGCSLNTNIPFSCIRSDCGHFQNCTESFIEKLLGEV